MTTIRIHASADASTVEAIRTRLTDATDHPIASVHASAGELVGDLVEVVVAADLGFEEESTVRGLVLETIDELRRPLPPADQVVDRLAAIEDALAGILSRLDTMIELTTAAHPTDAGTVHVDAAQEDAPPGP